MSGASKRVKKRKNERVAQYLCLDFWLFWTLVQREIEKKMKCAKKKAKKKESEENSKEKSKRG